jgi:hypothetical protein
MGVPRFDKVATSGLFEPLETFAFRPYTQGPFIPIMLLIPPLSTTLMKGGAICSPLHFAQKCRILFVPRRLSLHIPY